MFPWPWHFTVLWAPRWPASGDVELNGWTNSLFSTREITVVEKFMQACKVQRTHLRTTPGVPLYELESTLPPITDDDLLIAENLLERMKTRR